MKTYAVKTYRRKFLRGAERSEAILYNILAEHSEAIQIIFERVYFQKPNQFSNIKIL